MTLFGLLSFLFCIGPANSFVGCGSKMLAGSDKMTILRVLQGFPVAVLHCPNSCPSLFASRLPNSRNYFNRLQARVLAAVLVIG